MESSEPPSSSGHRLQTSMTRAGVEDCTAGLRKPSVWTSSGWWAILLWHHGPVHEFTGTWAARRNAGSGHEKAADAGLGLLLWEGWTPACARSGWRSVWLAVWTSLLPPRLLLPKEASSSEREISG